MKDLLGKPWVAKLAMCIAAGAAFVIGYRFTDGEAQTGLFALGTFLLGAAGVRRPGDAKP